MDIKIVIYGDEARQTFEVNQADYTKKVSISSVFDRTDYEEKDKGKGAIKEVIEIKMDEKSARQIMLALQKILF